MRILVVGGEAERRASFAVGTDAQIDAAPTHADALAALSAGYDLVILDAAPDPSDFIAEASARCAPTPAFLVQERDGDGAPGDEIVAADGQLIVADPLMHDVIARVDLVAPTEASVLITGETGVGKEEVARRLHAHSARAEMPFVAVNCAAIPETLLESELFGHERGAFTGAHQRRIGKFEEAHGGTLFLDEIAELDPRLQAKLLRALQTREIDRVGGARPVRVDVRIIAATNRSLTDAVRAGRFRDDLFYRLNVVPIEVPPLRARPKDIDALADYFLKRHAARYGRGAKRFSDAAKRAMRAANWPGNARELDNAVHRATLLAHGSEIGPEWFLAPADAGGQAPLSAPRLQGSLADVERQCIGAALERCGGNRTRAAAELGISVRTLRNKLKSYAPYAPAQGAGDGARLAAAR